MNLTQTLAAYHYDLPKEFIAQKAVEPRDQSKLLVFNRQNGQLKDQHFYELGQFLTANDVLVLNETKVFPARLLGKKQSGGKVELLLLKQTASDCWQAISKPGLKLGQKLFFMPADAETESWTLADLTESSILQAEVIQRTDQSAEVEVRFNFHAEKLWQHIEAVGLTPLPPYIHSQENERALKARYQTVYAKNFGSAAAPTAGLHFTPDLLQKLQQQGVAIERLTLHVGLGTFAKLSEQNLTNKTLHSEYYQIDSQVADRLNQAKQAGKRIIAVGTTTLRTLESAVLLSAHQDQLVAGARTTQLFVMPPYQFNFVDALITNFHLPESSLLMLVSAFTTFPNTSENFHDFIHSNLGSAYEHAKAAQYRFFSFGDAMFIHS